MNGAEAAQEQWVLAALREPGFADLRDENISYRPLPGALRADSERWTRVLMPLIGGGDPALHDLAIASLLEISSPFMGPASPKPPELLRKLLPWLSDANWSAASGRSLFIEELARQDIPECVSGLIAVVKQEQGGPVFAAAKALERYKPPAAVEPLRTALGHEPDEQTRQAISSALLACGAVDDAEAVAAVEAYGRHVVTREEPIHGGGLFGNIDKPAAPTSPESPLGEAISKKGLSDAVAQRLAARIEAIRPTEPAVATKLIELLSDSQSASVDRYLVRRAITATADEADLDVIQYLAARAPAARKRIAADLRTAAAGHGMPAGIAAAVLADEPISRAILANNADRDRAKGLLAMSRLTRTPLPLETVAHLMQSKDAELAAAAEAYLTNEASPAARALVLARHPGEVKVIGESEWPKERVDPLRREVASQEDGVVEVFALLSGGGFGDAGQRIVRIRRDGSATLTLHGYQGRSRHRLLTPAELADLRRFVAEDHIDDLPPLPWTTVTDGVWYEYIHLTPAGGRCIPMNNPSSAAAGSPYDLVARRFERLEQAGQYEVRYADAAKQIPGLHVLLSVPENQMILGIWRKGDDLRLLVGGDRNEGGASWRAVRDGKLAGPADPPPGRSPPQGWDDLPGELVLTSETNRASLRLADGSTVCQALGAGHWKKRLWKFKPSGGKAQLLTEDDAEYGPPLVTPDGKWIIADRGGEEPAGGPVVRIDVATGKRFPVALPPNVYYNVEAYVPPHGKVLLIGTPQSQPTDDPGKPRPRIFLLLDPATGKTEPITGDFTPLEKDWDPARHHPARKADCFWVAFSVTEQSAETEPSTSSTRIGLYDAHRFVFTPMLTLPGTWIGNREIWVDEDRREVLVAVNEDLVVAPITRQ